MKEIKLIDECYVGLMPIWQLFSNTYPNMPDLIFEYIATCYNDTTMDESEFADYWNDTLWAAEGKKTKKTISIAFPLKDKDKITVTFKREYVESER